MKVLFTADLHINLNKKNVPKEWAINRYKLLFDEILKLCYKAEVLVLGGDIFDKLPTVPEMNLYFNFIYSIPINCIIYDGNHEAEKRAETFLTGFKDVTKYVNNRVDILDKSMNKYGIDFIPYNQLKNISKYNNTSNILCTHVRGNIPPYVKSEIDLKLLKKWKVVLAGDLHSYTNSQENILYPGSPCTTSFHRNRVDTGVILFDTDNLQHEWIKLQLPQLIRKRVKSEEEMNETSYDHTIYELEGTMEELSKVSSSELLDKKIVSKSDTASLSFKDLSSEEELRKYMEEVLDLENNTVERLINIHNDIY